MLIYIVSTLETLQGFKELNNKIDKFKYSLGWFIYSPSKTRLFRIKMYMFKNEVKKYKYYNIIYYNVKWYKIFIEIYGRNFNLCNTMCDVFKKYI